MSNVNLFIANASGHIGNNRAAISAAFERAAEIATQLLKLDAVDIICIDDPAQVIPETGMSGFTPNRHLVYLYVDSTQSLDTDEIFYTLCHEFAHAKRYDGPSYGTTLFDSMIFEGLGVAIEEEVSGTAGSFLSNYIKEKENKSLLKQVVSHFDDRAFDRYYWFINESAEIPRWTGYRVGYYIVSEYIKKTNKKASDLAMEDSSIFRKFVRDGLGSA